MTPDNPLLKQLIETFNAELESLLQIIENNLQKMKQGPSPESITEIARSGRNIKVSALAVGVDNIGALAEYLEKLFAPTNNISSELMSLTARTVEGMREAMQDFIAGRPSSANIQELLRLLELQLHQTKKVEPAPTPVDGGSKEPQPTPSTNTAEREFLNKIIETFKTELQDNLISITNNLLQLEKGGQSSTESLHLFEEIFRAAHNIKGSARGVGAMDVGEIAHHIETLFSGMQKNNANLSFEIINLCLQAIDYMNEAMRCYSEGIPLSFNLEDYLKQLEHCVQSPQQMTYTPPAKFIKPEETSLQRTQMKGNEFESIRIELRNLERISADMEEVQSIKIAIEEQYSKLTKVNVKLNYALQSWKSTMGANEPRLDLLFSKHFAELSEISHATHLIQKELHIPVNELSILLNGLQDEVRRMRLLPVETQLRNLPRLVRDLANELNKQVNLEIKISDVKIDKMILDGIKDPLVHLLRNAIDHGIESAETRQKSGKPVEGSITIEVNQADHQIVFKISDDGAGINVDEIMRTALKKNIVTQEELDIMSQEDLVELIFRPGFSTREMATDISGRGVGLDVVRSNLIHLKGQVNVESQPGYGTQFFLRVPITLVTDRGLFVSCGKKIFVMVTSSVESVFLLKKQDIIHVEGCPTVLVKEQPVLLSCLATLLQLEKNIPNTSEQLSVVVINKDKDRIALLVDEILGEREMILKPLQEPLTSIPCVIGATLTGSKQVNFVLNSSELIKRALLRGL